MNRKIYLAGPISGLTYDEAQDWRQDFTAAIDPRIECYSPLRGKDYLRKYGSLEGSYEDSPLSTDRGITSRDRWDCMGADLVVFNLLGAERITVGTMIEIGWADANRVPSILVIEKEGNPHDHPMVRHATNFRVDNLNDARKIAELILLPTVIIPKGPCCGVVPVQTPVDISSVSCADCGQQVSALRGGKAYELIVGDGKFGHYRQHICNNHPPKINNFTAVHPVGDCE